MTPDFQIKSHGYMPVDIRAVAEIHSLAIPTGFLSKCPRLLELMYSFIAEDSACALIVAYEAGEVVGFVSGTKNSAAMFKNFLKKNGFNAALAALPYVFSLGFLRKAFETLMYPKKIKSNVEVEAELLSMAVKKEHRGSGVAASLFKAFVVAQHEMHVPAFRIVAGDQLKQANGFYAKMGAKPLDVIEVHGGAKSQVYLYTV